VTSGLPKRNMSKTFSIFYKYFYSAALIMSCCFVCSCENDQRAIDDATKPVKTIDEVHDVQSYLSQEGIVKAKLIAPLMYRVTANRGGDTNYVEFPHSLHVDFFNDSTQRESWLDALYARYFENYNKVYLQDSVVVISVKGDTLRCRNLWWDQNKAIFYTDSVATYHSPGNDITGGRGMEATQDFRSVTFKYPLGTVKVAANGFAE
jgi:LPS export ABC transporter protein LptC